MNVDKQSPCKGTEGQENENCIKNKYVEADIYHMNKEFEEIDIDKEIEEFLACVDEYVKDVPDLSDEEIKAGVDRILSEVYPDEKRETPVVPISNGRNKKRPARKVLFVAAAITVLVVLSIGGMFVLGDDSELETNNGVATYDDGSVRITFFGENGEEYITVDTLLKDLDAHGYKDIMFPEAFMFDDTCKVSVPRYTEDGAVEQVAFDVVKDGIEFYFGINALNENNTSNMPDLENAKTIVCNKTNIYVFEHSNDFSTIEFIDNNLKYFVSAKISYLEMIKIAETFK